MTDSTHPPAAPSSPPVTETRDPSAMDELRHAIDAVGVLVSNLWPRVSREDATAVRQAWDRVYTTWAAALNPTVTPGTQPPQLDALYAKGRVIVDSVFGPPRVPGPTLDDLDNDGWCIDCGDEFHFDDTGGWCIYNPPCVCGMHCRHCHELAEREDDADDCPDDEELTHG
ncbi:MAG TPA: hypothetical protein VN085_07230 [Vicinamibacterales bacterium]|nr:hypothetical protein [Vicinamibacterales bacterium]